MVVAGVSCVVCWRNVHGPSSANKRTCCGCWCLLSGPHLAHITVTAGGVAATMQRRGLRKPFPLASHSGGACTLSTRTQRSARDVQLLPATVVRVRGSR